MREIFHQLMYAYIYALDSEQARAYKRIVEKEQRGEHLTDDEKKVEESAIALLDEAYDEGFSAHNTDSLSRLSTKIAAIEDAERRKEMVFLLTGPILNA